MTRSLALFAQSDGVDDDEAGFAGGVGRDGFERARVDDAAAAAFHLLEVGPRFDVPHENQTFERLDVGAVSIMLTVNSEPR